MTWFARWRFPRSHREAVEMVEPQPSADASAARQSAEAELSEALARQARVSAVSQRMAQLRETNHFAELIGETFQRRRR